MFDDDAMNAKWEACPTSLQDIIAEFQDASPEERLELMVDFSEALPDLPEWLQGRRDEMAQVHECQTPVFLHTVMEQDGVQFYFDIPRESPTVRGYASILATGLNGVLPEQVLQVPDDIYRLLGLHEAVSQLRLRGLHALVGYMKRQVVALP